MRARIKTRWAAWVEWRREHTLVRLSLSLLRGILGALFIMYGPEPWGWVFAGAWFGWVGVQLWRMRVDERKFNHLVSHDVDRFLIWVTSNHVRDDSGFCKGCTPAQMHPCEHVQKAAFIAHLPEKRKADFFFTAIAPAFEDVRREHPEAFEEAAAQRET